MQDELFLLYFPFLGMLSSTRSTSRESSEPASLSAPVTLLLPSGGKRQPISMMAANTATAALHTNTKFGLPTSASSENTTPNTLTVQKKVSKSNIFPPRQIHHIRKTYMYSTPPPSRPD